MHRYLLLISIAALLIFWAYRSQTTSKEGIVLNLKGRDYRLEVADTVALQAKGLSGRTSLCPDCGMIFAFNSEDSKTFWMKETLIPLDMIFLNSQGVVVAVHTAQPEPGVPLHQLKIYSSDRPARYVIELNALEAGKLGLKVGDTIALPQL